MIEEQYFASQAEQTVQKSARMIAADRSCLLTSCWSRRIQQSPRLPRWLALAGVVVTILAWGRGIGSATGLYFLEVLIYANVPAFLWLGYYGWRVSSVIRTQSAPAT